MDRVRYLIDVNEGDAIALTGGVNDDGEVVEPRYEPLWPVQKLEPLGVFGKQLRHCHHLASLYEAHPNGLPNGMTFKPLFEPDKWAHGKWWGNV